MGVRPRQRLAVPEPQDRALLSEIAQAKLADPDADVRRLEAALGSGGRAMIALVRNADPERVPELVAALPDSVRRDIEYLDLSRRQLRDLRAHLLLIHGRDDPLIPATESLALAAAVPPGHADVFVVGNLSHVEIQPGAIPDTLLLWRAAYRLLTLRDGLTVPNPARCALAGAVTTDSGSGDVGDQADDTQAALQVALWRRATRRERRVGMRTNR